MSSKLFRTTGGPGRFGRSVGDRDDRDHEIAGAGHPAAVPHRATGFGGQLDAFTTKPHVCWNKGHVDATGRNDIVTLSSRHRGVIAALLSCRPATPSHGRYLASEELAHSIVSSPYMEGISAAQSECAGDGRRRLARCVRSIWYDPLPTTKLDSPPSLPLRQGYTFSSVWILAPHRRSFLYRPAERSSKGEGGVERKEMPLRGRSFVRISETDRPFGDVE
jgi:hypothetical protein